MIRTENYTRELLFIFFAQRKIIILVTVLILVLSTLIAFFWPPTYAAFGSILVRGKKLEKSPETIEKGAVTRAYVVTKEDLFSEVEIITSFDVIERTIKDLIKKNLYNTNNLPKISLYNAIKRKMKRFIKGDAGAKGINSQFLTDEVYKIKNSIKTEVIPASNVIEITLNHKDPKAALTILNALMSQYIQYRMGVYSPSEAEAFFTQQAEKFKEGLEKREEDLMDFVKKTRMSDPRKEMDNNLIIKKELESQLHLLKNEYIEKKSNVEHLEKVLNDKSLQYFSFMDSRPINLLSGKLQDLFIEKGNLLRRYHPSSDKVKLIDKQIDETYAALKSEVMAYKNNIKVELNIINEKIISIEKRLEDINGRNVQLQRQLIDSNRIAREAGLLKFSYDNFAKRREEAKVDNVVAATNLSSYIRILSNPFPSDGPVFPKPMVVIPLGILIGFITGCSLGFLNDYFDHTFKKPSDVYNYAGLPVIFSIPEWEKNKKTQHIGGLIIILVLSTFIFLIFMPGVVPSGKTAVERSIEKKEKTSFFPKGSEDTAVVTKSKKSLEIKDAGSTGAKLTDDMEKRNEDGKAHFSLNHGRAVPFKKALMVKTGKDIKNGSVDSLINKSIILFDKNKGLWFLQVHSFKKKDLAIKATEKLQKAGWQSFVKRVHIKEYGLTHRVLIGPFSQKKEALKVRLEGPGPTASYHQHSTASINNIR